MLRKYLLSILSIFFGASTFAKTLDVPAPAFGYGNTPYFWAAYDPPYDQSQFPYDISPVIYPNFMKENPIQWINTQTRDHFILYNIIDPVYDGAGNLIGGYYQWAKVNVTVAELKKKK